MRPMMMRAAAAAPAANTFASVLSHGTASSSRVTWADPLLSRMNSPPNTIATMTMMSPRNTKSKLPPSSLRAPWRSRVNRIPACHTRRDPSGISQRPGHVDAVGIPAVVREGVTVGEAELLVEAAGGPEELGRAGLQAEPGEA